MIIHDKNKTKQTRTFLNLSKKALFFWSSFIMGLFALFFFAGILVGRGSIQVDLGQDGLLLEIEGLAESTNKVDTDDMEEAPDNSSEFDFYKNLSVNDPSKVTVTQPSSSSRKKTRQVIKKRLDIVKPESLKDDETVSEYGDLEPSDDKITEPDREKAKPETAEKPRSEPVLKAKADTGDNKKKEKTEAADKKKKELEKAEVADKKKKELEKAEAADKKKKEIEKAEAANKKKKETATKTASKNPEPEKKDKSVYKYSLQVAALKGFAEDADGMVKKLKGKGYPAYWVKSSDNDSWYKIRVGSFKDRTDAESTLNKLKKDKFEAFLVPR